MPGQLRSSPRESAPTKRLQRRVERLLDQAEQSADRADWRAAKAHAREVLLIDPRNRDAKVLLGVAEAMLSEADGQPLALPAISLALRADERSSVTKRWLDQHWFVALVALETLLALALGFLFLGDKSFWLDEATTARLVRLDWSGLRSEVGNTETNQAAYHVALKVWASIGGGSEFWLRSFSVLCSAAAIPAIAALGRSLFSTRAGLIAGLLLALNPVFVTYAQEARGYALVMLLVTLSSYAFVQLVRRPTPGMAVAFVALSAMAAYTHFFAILVTGAQLASLPMLRRASAPWALLAQSTASLGVLLLPIAVAALRPNSALDWVPEPGLADLVDHLQLQTGGTLQSLAYLAIGMVGLATAWRLLRAPEGAAIAWPALLVVSWLVLPTALAFSGSFIKPVFVSRYLIVSLPALALLVALGLSEVRPRTLAHGLTGLLVLLAVPALDRVYFDSPKENWRDATSFILSQAQPGDAIVFHSPWVEEPYNYYAAKSTAGATRPDVAHYDAAADEALGERLQEEGYERVWLVLSHAALSALPELAEARVNLEDSLDSAFDVVVERGFYGPIQVRLYD